MELFALYNKAETVMKLLYLVKGVTARVIVGLAGILVARFLSKEDYGLIVSIAALAAFFLTLARLGLNEYAIVRSAGTALKSLRVVYLQTLDKLQNASVLLMFIPGLVLSVILFGNGSNLGLLILFFSAIYARGYIDVIRNGVICADLQSTGKNIVFINAQLIFSLASMAAVGFLYFLHLDSVGYVFVLLATTLVFHFVGVWAAAKHVESKNVLIPKLSSLLFYKYGLSRSLFKNKAYFLSEIMAFVYTQGNTLALASVSSSVEVARFSVVSSLIMASYIIPGVVYQWSLPRLAALRNDKNGFVKEAFRNARQVILLTVLPGVIVFVVSPQIIAVLLGEKYSSSSEILRLMAVVFIVHSICFIPAACLTALGKQSERSKIQFMGGMVGIIITTLLGIFQGAYGAAIGCLVAELILMVGYIKTAKMAINNIALGGR